MSNADQVACFKWLEKKAPAVFGLFQQIADNVPEINLSASSAVVGRRHSRTYIASLSGKELCLQYLGLDAIVASTGFAGNTVHPATRANEFKLLKTLYKQLGQNGLVTMNANTSTLTGDKRIKVSPFPIRKGTGVPVSHEEALGFTAGGG